MGLLPLTLDCKFACVLFISKFPTKLFVLFRESGGLCHVSFACTILGNRECRRFTCILGVYRGHSLLLHERMEYWILSVSEF